MSPSAGEKVASGHLADARDEPRAGLNGRVGSTEPSEDRARHGEEKDDKDLVTEWRDLADLEELRGKEETEEEADERPAESEEDHSFARSFPFVCGDAQARPKTMWPPAAVRRARSKNMRGRIRPVTRPKYPNG